MGCPPGHTGPVVIASRGNLSGRDFRGVSDCGLIAMGAERSGSDPTGIIGSASNRQETELRDKLLTNGPVNHLTVFVADLVWAFIGLICDVPLRLRQDGPGKCPLYTGGGG